MKTRVRCLAGMVSFIALLIGARALAQEEPGCENELLTEAEVRQAMTKPSRGVKESHLRIPAEQKQTLKKSAAQDAAEQRPARPPAPSREIIRAQREYLATAERLKRAHTGTDEELDRALRAAKNKILGSYER